MKILKIFLASSVVEFKNERQELAAFVNTLNKICVRKDLYLEMKLCEDISSAVAMERKQNEYNECIRRSDYLLMLFGKSAGKYTIEEFDVAFKQFQAAGAPKIYIYFRKMPESIGVEKSVIDFIKRLERQLEYPYSMFAHLDVVKFNLVMTLMRDGQLNCDMEFLNGRMLLDKNPVLSLENVPFADRKEP